MNGPFPLAVFAVVRERARTEEPPRRTPKRVRVPRQVPRLPRPRKPAESAGPAGSVLPRPRGPQDEAPATARRWSLRRTTTR